MRPNEEFVLNALVSKIGGTFTDGEDPPDAYLKFESKCVAVEVTALVQQLVDEDGSKRSRIKDDAPAANLANILNEEIGNQIPNGKYIFLVLPAPINNIRKTKKKLTELILNMIRENLDSNEIDIFANKISINVYNRPGKSQKKIAAAITNRFSSANISLNAQLLLVDRISTKNEKVKLNDKIKEYWLALYNDYWIADMQTYKNAYLTMKIKHSFSRIYIINGGGEVFQLY